MLPLHFDRIDFDTLPTLCLVADIIRAMGYAKPTLTAEGRNALKTWYRWCKNDCLPPPQLDGNGKYIYRKSVIKGFVEGTVQKDADGVWMDTEIGKPIQVHPTYYQNRAA